MLNFSTPEQMDWTVHALLCQCLRLYRDIPGASKVPDALADWLLAFIEAELALRH